jgi:hypothetical protein
LELLLLYWPHTTANFPATWAESLVPLLVKAAKEELFDVDHLGRLTSAFRSTVLLDIDARLQGTGISLELYGLNVLHWNILTG